jgi:hypothetical protein
MWKEGMSATQIGNLIGKTRNAVIGKMCRLNIGSSGKEPKPRDEQPKKRKRRTYAVMQPPLEVAEPLVPPSPPVEGGVTMEALKDGMCRWPVADGRSCGAETGGKRVSYCAVHRGVGLVTPRPWKPKERSSR